MERAAGYFRVSTKRQAGERHVSLAVQRERFYARCEAEGLLPAGEYTDTASGRRDDRREYQRLLEACKRGEVEVVVVMFLDRFGRNADEIMLQYIQLERIHKVRIVCTDEQIGNRLIRYVSAWKAGEESERNGVRTRAAIVRRLQNGEHWARVPYGWRLDDKTHKLVIDEAEAQVVRRMAELLAQEHLGRIRVARQLNAEGYRRRDGSEWTSTSVGKLLARERNAGTVTWGAAGSRGNRDGSRDSVTLTVPGILAPDMIAAVREQEARRKLLSGRTVRDSPYVFAGIIRCGHCGYTLIGSKSKNPRAKHWTHFYLCRGNREFGAAVCDYRYYNAARLETAVLTELKKLADPAVVAESCRLTRPELVRDYASERRALEQELQAVQRELHETYRLYRNGTIPSEDQLRDLNLRFLNRQKAAEQRLRAIAADQAAEAHRREQLAQLPQRVTSLLDEWATLTTAARKARLQQVLSRVVVYRDGGFDLQLRGVEGD